MTHSGFPKMSVLVVGVAILVIGLAFFSSQSSSDQRTVDLLITNAHVVTLDPDSHVYTSGWIAINQGKIVAVGDSPAIPYRGHTTIDASGQAALPGLINTHSHAAMTLLRGLADSEPLSVWLTTMSDYEKHLTPEHVYWGTLLATSEMVRSGTTTFNDMYFYPEQVAKASADAGIRAIVRLPLTQQGEEITVDETLTTNNPNPALITFSVAPNPLVDFALPQLKKIAELAGAKQYLVHLHFEETAQARKDSLAKHQQTPMQLLAASGLLRTPLVLAHGVDLNEAELDLLAQHPQTGIAYNPKSNLKLASQTADVPAMLRRNISVGFGTDGAASSNTLDLFSHMNFAAVGFLKCQDQADYCHNQYTVSPEKILRLATIDAARVVGLGDDIGSIEVDKQADIILVDLRQPHQVPLHDIYSTLVYSTTGHDVTDSIIAGQVVMENRVLTTFDQKEAIEQVQSIAAQLKNKQP